MFGAIAVMALAPWLDTSTVRSGRYRPMFKWWFALLVVDFIVLMWCGAMPAEEPYATISLIAAAYCLPISRHPAAARRDREAAAAAATIEEDFNAHYAPATGGTKTVAAE